MIPGSGRFLQLEMLIEMLMMCRTKSSACRHSPKRSAIAGRQRCCAPSLRLPFHDTTRPNLFGIALAGILTSFAAIGLAGCSDRPDPNRELLPDTVPVSGTVIFNGSPLAGAKVCFHPREVGGKAALGTTDQQGRFQLRTFGADDGAIPGPYIVTVDLKKVAMIPRPNDDSGSQTAFRMQVTPEKYKNKETSDLSEIVSTAGENVFRIELQGEAPAVADQMGAHRLKKREE